MLPLNKVYILTTLYLTTLYACLWPAIAFVDISPSLKKCKEMHYILKIKNQPSYKGAHSSGLKKGDKVDPKWIKGRPLF